MKARKIRQFSNLTLKTFYNDKALVTEESVCIYRKIISLYSSTVNKYTKLS